MKRMLLALFLFVSLLPVAWCDVAPPPSQPFPLSSTAIPQPSDWNSTIVGGPTFINNSIVAALNVLNTKGDTYVYDGTTGLRQFSATDDGTHADILVANSALASGMSYLASYTGLLPVTTKGDVTVCNGATVTREPVGTNGQLLSADSTQSTGTAWVTTSFGKFPSGSIVAWSPAGAGTTTIPSGFLVCDGTVGTPNLIGKFILGTRPNGSSATPATGGFGARTADAASIATIQHSHTVHANSVATGGPSANTPLTTTFYTNNTAAVGHVHNGAASAGGIFALANYEPSDWALIYLIQQ